MRALACRAFDRTRGSCSRAVPLAGVSSIAFIWSLDEHEHTLDRRRRYFNDLDSCISKLITETEHKCVQGSLGGRVGGKGSCGDDSQVGTRAVVVSKQLNFGTGEQTYYTKLVSFFLLIRKGRNFIVRSTKQEKLVVISEWKADRSTFAGCARLIGL